MRKSRKTLAAFEFPEGTLRVKPHQTHPKGIEITGTWNGKVRVRERFKDTPPARAHERVHEVVERLRQKTTKPLTGESTLANAAVLYLDWCLEKGKVPNWGLGRVLEDEVFCALELDEITNALIHDMCDRVFDGCKNSTKNQHGVGAVVGLINWCADRRYCKPIKGKRYPKEATGRKAVTLDWVSTFVATAQAMGPKYLGVGEQVLFMATTGRRAVDCRRCEWRYTNLSDDVIEVDGFDIAPRSVFLPKTKNGEEWTIELDDVLAAMLKELRSAQRDPEVLAKVYTTTRERFTEGTVFGQGRPTGWRERFAEVLEESGLPHSTPHQVGRHTFASKLHELGYTPAEIAAMGGWKSIQVVIDTYLHSDRRVREGVSAMTGALSNAKVLPSSEFSRNAKVVDGGGKIQ